MSLDDQLEEEPETPSARAPDPEEELRRRVRERTLAFRPGPSAGGSQAASDAGAPEEPAAGASPEDAGGAGRGDLGAAGVATMPRELPKAFTRAIPAASTRDVAWNRLPLGRVGKAKVRLAIDERGKLVEADVEPRAPAHLERLVERTALALRGGSFVLRAEQRGEQVLLLSGRISRREVGRAPLELGYEAPTASKPGRAYFQLPSGRFVEIFVALQRLP